MTLFFAPISTYIHIFLRQKPFRELHRDVGVKNEGGKDGGQAVLIRQVQSSIHFL